MPLAFQEWLIEQRLRNINILQGAGDLLVIGRIQGQLEILDVVLKIKQES